MYEFFLDSISQGLWSFSSIMSTRRPPLSFLAALSTTGPSSSPRLFTLLPPALLGGRYSPPTTVVLRLAPLPSI